MNALDEIFGRFFDRPAYDALAWQIGGQAALGQTAAELVRAYGQQISLVELRLILIALAERLTDDRLTLRLEPVERERKAEPGLTCLEVGGETLMLRIRNVGSPARPSPVRPDEQETARPPCILLEGEEN